MLPSSVKSLLRIKKLSGRPGLGLIDGILLLFILLGAGCRSTPDPSARLQALLAQDWEERLREDPLLASRLGDRRYNHLWPDVSLEALEARHRRRQQVLQQLAQIDPNALSSEDRLNHALLGREYELEVEGFPYGWHLLPLNQRGGIQTADEVADALRFTTREDFEDWLARLQGFPVYLHQHIGLMREGIRRGMLHPKVIMERVPDQISAQLVEDPAESPFFRPFHRLPESWPEEEREEFRRRALRAIEEEVLPAFRRFQTFFNEEYLPRCYPEVGIWQLPRGREMYEYRARLFTTTSWSPQAIHELGLQEVKRIRQEMETIVQQLDFRGSFHDFLHHLRSDPRFYHRDPAALLQEYRAIAKRIDPTLVRLFGRLPRIPYGVEPIPETIAPDTTTAYYRPPAADGSRAGTYFVNLYRPEVRPRYEMEALSIHEAVPGHHLQIALAMELDLPEFRRFGGYTAFVEGWALYAESLGEELGFYQDPYSKFGQLTYEMWRAVRLVVDTGIHSLQWSRARAIEFFLENAAKSEHDIVNEVDRYIAWPGQALAYKIGALKIKELRARAEEALGDAFDIRRFHDAVLAAGALPLDVLETRLHQWIEEEQTRSGTPGRPSGNR